LRISQSFLLLLVVCLAWIVVNADHCYYCCCLLTCTVLSFMRFPCLTAGEQCYIPLLSAVAIRCCVGYQNTAECRAEAPPICVQQSPPLQPRAPPPLLLLRVSPMPLSLSATPRGSTQVLAARHDLQHNRTSHTLRANHFKRDRTPMPKCSFHMV